MREREVERRLVTAVKKRGGLAPKFTSPGLDGVPDRLVLLPDGRLAFVEVKAPGQKMRPLQLYGSGSWKSWAFASIALTGRSRLEVSWMKYKPHEYQTYATRFLLEHPISCLMLDCGLGKTVITLTALWDLVLDSFDIGRVLVIAPKRVAENVWVQEIEKWEHLAGLTAVKVLGSEQERRSALNTPAFLYIINRENVIWLVKNRHWDFDMVVVDELSRSSPTRHSGLKLCERCGHW